MKESVVVALIFMIGLVLISSIIKIKKSIGKSIGMILILLIGLFLIGSYYAQNPREFLSKMVFIPAGEFRMGSAREYSGERPIHKVYLHAYYIDKYEVTNKQFCRFLNKKGNQKEGRVTWLNINDEDCLIEYINGKYQPKSGYGNHPVVMVSWYGARAYARWAGKRLPTEAEWEKAAKGGLVWWDRKYPWGDSIDSSKANYGGNIGRTMPVGSYPPNSYGLYDMAGNVWEWVSDWYDSNYYLKSPYNPLGPSTGSYRVNRGGGWRDNDPYLRCAYCGYDAPCDTSYALGFRCAKSP